MKIKTRKTFGRLALAAAVTIAPATVALAGSGEIPTRLDSKDMSCAAYTVVKGDTLAGIAAAKLGDASRAKEIFSLNAHQLKNPDEINIGQALVMPCEKAAVSHKAQVKPQDVTSNADAAPVAFPDVSDVVQPEYDTTWTAKPGDFLVPVLVSWGTRAGYDVIVEQNSDWKFAVGYTHEGSFRDAVDTVVYGFSTAAYPPVVVFYTNNVMTIGVR